jgi:hypothetical protein
MAAQYDETGAERHLTTESMFIAGRIDGGRDR